MAGHLEKSALLAHYRAGDERFADELARCAFPDDLAALAELWKTDPRPWARRQLLDYLDRPFDHPGHEPLVKRLFKHAEAQRDDVLMSAFAVAFDRSVRRFRRLRWLWSSETRESSQVEALVVPRRRLRIAKQDRSFDPRTGQYAARQISKPRKDGQPPTLLFTHRTRYYLCRRAWRYLRRMGFQQPDRYVTAAAVALRLFRDEDLRNPENLLDNWTLLHICFGKHPAIRFDARRANVAPGRSLAELVAAPYFPELWKTQSAFDALLDVLTTARSRPVRLWATALLRREHAPRLRALDAARLVPLLDHADGEVQQFGTEVLRELDSLPRLGIADWLRMLETKNPEALAGVCEAMARHVKAERLTVTQCVDLCLARPAPVARLGLDFLQKLDDTKHNAAQLVRLAGCQCEAAGGEIGRFALARLGATGAYSADAVVGFFDSRLESTRRAALQWLAPGTLGYDDPPLWAKLIETPYDDVRLRLVELLQRRERAPGAAGDTLAPVWRSVVLGVHRGGRHKPAAVRQLADVIARNLDQAARLLPVLAVAVHSLRGPERRAGLSAVTTLGMRAPSLLPLIERAIPALRLAEAVPA